MTQQQLRNLQFGEFVHHKEYGLCVVAGHKLAFAVDLSIMEEDKSFFGSKGFSEARHFMLTKPNGTREEIFERYFGKTKKCEIEFKPGLRIYGKLIKED